MTSLIGKTIVIRSLNDKGFGTEIESHVNIQFQPKCLGEDTNPEQDGIITISQLKRLNRILIQGAYRMTPGDNGEPTVLNSLSLDELNAMEIFTLNQVGHWTELKSGIDITKLSQLTVLKVVE